MRRYHHIGIPTTSVRSNETYLEEFRMYVSGYEESDYGIEWMRFEPDCPLPDLVKSTAHVAFVVEDLERELAGREVLIAPNSPSPGLRVAFIIDGGAPVEFLEFRSVDDAIEGSGIERADAHPKEAVKEEQR